MLSAVLFFSSCSNQVFPVMTLEMNYAMRADTKAEREIKAKVKIYYSEADVPGKYEVLSLNQYAPWFAIPIIYSGKSQIEKKYLSNATKTAYEQGANGIIVLTPNHYLAINILGFDSDTAKIAQPVNIIADMSLANKIADGTINKVKKAMQKQFISAFEDEIKVNIQYASTLDDVKLIREKINIYKGYLNSNPAANKKGAKSLAKFEKKVNSKEASIKKKMGKASKKTGKKSK